MNELQQRLAKHEKIIGSVASTLAVIMFVSLIEVFLSNLQGKSTIVIQPLATALNGFFWSLYAYGKNDRFLLIPNVLALFLGLATALTAIV